MASSHTTTPLGQRIQHLLLKRKGEPLSLLELQTMLRKQGQRVTIERLRVILSDTTVFTALPEQRYVLRDQFEPVQGTSTPNPLQQFFLTNLPQAQKTYVVLDLETSGLNPQYDQIIQIAALLVQDERPIVLHSWYVQCAAERLTPSLRRTLHLTDELVQQITTAPPIDAIWGDVMAFVADHTLVIHNARFDIAFLYHHDPTFANKVVDTMELALLVVPALPRYTLSAIAQTFNINVDTLDTHGIDGLPVGFHPSNDTLHNAITDVLLLNAVYRALLQQWHATPSEQTTIYATLLPDVWAQPTHLATSTLNLMPLLQMVETDETTPSPTTAPFDNTPLVLLERVMTHAALHVRESQQTMVQLITNALANDESVIIEAPTGTGKTLGYLIPTVWTARVHGRTIALATAFKNLQDQLRDEVARLQTVMPFRAQLLKGASSYICFRALQQVLDEAHNETPTWRFVLTCLVQWVLHDTTATFDEIPYWLRRTFPETTMLEYEIAVDMDMCTTTSCIFYQHCPFFTAYRRGQQSDILIINQALWLTKPVYMPPFDALVIDEAHNLEDMATSALTQEVSEEQLRRVLQRLFVPGTRRGALQRTLDIKPDDTLRATIHMVRRGIGQVLRLLSEFRTTLAHFVVGCDERLDPERGAQLRLTGAPERVYPTIWRSVQQAINQIWHVYMPTIVNGLQQIIAWLPAEHGVLCQTIAVILDTLVAQNNLLGTILHARLATNVTWIDVCTDEQTGSWGFFTAPITVAPLLAERYSKLRSVILTSATLTTGANDFHFFVERLGLRECLSHTHMLSGELPYHENVLLGLPTYFNYTPTQSTMQSYVEELSEELLLLFRATDGRGLVLFTARTRLEDVWHHNATRLEQHGIAVFAQRSGESRQQLIEQFRAHGHAVLYGLKSFWEGVDVPGEALSVVVMEKLPYPYIGDPVHAARREAIARQNGREFFDYLFPLMVIQFKQGFGRLIRTHNDCGVVLLYDKRVARKSYLPDLLNALPGFQPRDVAAERSRRTFYQLIAERLPHVINGQKEDTATLLATLPDTLHTHLEQYVQRYAIPDLLSDKEYATWRPRILDALKALYGFDEFRTPEQEAAFRAMLTGHDTLVVLPTGAGKSLVFQLPALLRRGTTIVCSPLIALMRDQIDKLVERGIEIAAALMGGQNAAEREDILARVRAGRVRLLYIAPERLRDPVLLSTLAATPIRQIVVDEAHCVALWGPSFRPDFLVLPRIYQQLTHRPPVAAFTATATPLITDAIITGLNLHDPHIIRTSINRPELQLLVLDRTHPYHAIRSKNEQIQRLMLLVQVADRCGDAMLIYVATTNESEYLARLLQVAGYAARAYHGKMPVQERANVGELFMEGLLSIVVCTKAFGMGIDKPDIRYVVHFHMPGDLESYFQEVGRAGRDGNVAYGVLLYHPSDERIQRYFIEQSRPDSALLHNLWQWIATQPTVWVLEPQPTCEQFDIDELALRRALYLLEQAGLLLRGADVTLRGTLTLLGTWHEVLHCVNSYDMMLLEQLHAVCPVSSWSPQEIVLADVAQQIGVSVQVVEDTLIRLSQAEGCIYRPWEKGYQITRIAPPNSPLTSVGDDAVAMLVQKLTSMKQYINEKGCRWQTLRRYFGEDAGEPCGTCDRCAPEQHYPWSGKTGRDVPDVSDFLDLATTLLELVDWNERRMQDGSLPFGIGSLVRILRGDEYALMKHTAPGAAADARRRTLRSCPFWGVCRTLRRSVTHLDTLFRKLEHEGYIARAVEHIDDGSYEYATITERGKTQLYSGERLGWS